MYFCSTCPHKFVMITIVLNVSQLTFPPLLQFHSITVAFSITIGCFSNEYIIHPVNFFPPTPVKTKMFLIIYVVIVHCLKHSNDYDFMKWILLNEFSIQICC